MRSPIRNAQLAPLFFVSIAVLLVPATSAFAFPARFGLAPDNDEALYLSAIRSARQELLINAYELDHPEITQAVIDEIRSGVSVQILIEGQPFGRPSREEVTELGEIRDAMTKARNPGDRLFVMTNEESGMKRRFRYDHAKYAVIDSSALVVGSENLAPTGHPQAGSIGNRGWEVLLEDPALARQARDIFTSDSRTDQGDVLEVGAGDELPVDVAKPHGPDKPGNEPRPVPALAAGAGDVTQADLLTSPNSLDGIVNLIRSAREHVEIEEMSLPHLWRSSLSGKTVSPIVSALIDAARRGIVVRVLLNNDRVFVHGPKAATENELTVQYLSSLAASEKIPLSARIVDIAAAGISYIHNKGILVDGARVLVSSINGSENSVVDNREMGVVLESPSAASYFGQAFDLDWQRSATAAGLQKSI